MATVLELLKTYKLTRRKLSNKFNIPYPTVLKWCLPEDNENRRECPQYVIRLLKYCLEYEARFGKIDV